MDAEQNEQQEIQEALQRLIPDLEGPLTGWIIIYEELHSDGKSAAGHVYGPAGMTTWRALGLVEWARRFSLSPDEND